MPRFHVTFYAAEVEAENPQAALDAAAEQVCNTLRGGDMPDSEIADAELNPTWPPEGKT